MKVVVLMSTFNGGRYLSEQIASILRQLPPDGLLMVRDDGSTDDTCAQLARFQDARIAVEQGTNIGFGASFLKLLAQAPSWADLVMFSDQDDVWLEDKIERAWSHLAPLGELPGLYCSAQKLVDESLSLLGVSPAWPRGPSMPSAVVENIVTGCTAALNRSAAALLRRAGVPPEVRFHDWWMYLVVSAFGQVLVDDHPTILYRQHRANTIGRGAGWWGRHLQIVRFLQRNDWTGMLLGQVQALWRCYGTELPAWQRTLLLHYFAIDHGRVRARWRLIFSLRLWRQSGGQELLFRGLLALYLTGMWPPRTRRMAL